MGKRSNYVRVERDFYPTPPEAVWPLVTKFLDQFNHPITYCEPCAGDGRLISHISHFSDHICLLAIDKEPKADYIIKADALNLTEEALEHCDMIITNPPYTWSQLQPLLDFWIPLRPTALLLPADYMHNKRFAPYVEHCTTIVSVGRVKWIEGSKTAGVDNYAWYIFMPQKQITKFIGR